jgi:hypothetical protein
MLKIIKKELEKKFSTFNKESPALVDDLKRCRFCSDKITEKLSLQIKIGGLGNSISNLLTKPLHFITVQKMCIEKKWSGSSNRDENLEPMQKSGKTKYLASVLERGIKYYTDSGFIVSPTDRRCVSKNSLV